MSTQSAVAELDPAIYNLLFPSGNVESGLATIGVLGVFNFRAVPQNQAFPYITIGDALEMPWNELQTRGYNVAYTIHIWSRQRGSSESNAIVARLNALLDQPQIPLTLQTQKHVSTLFNRCIKMLDPDGLTLHTILKYQIVTQEE